MTTNKPKHDSELRAAIIAEMKRRRDEDSETCSRIGWPLFRPTYCTWWFKFKIPLETKVIRRELARMERDGVVSRSERSTSNNTQWILVEHEVR